MIWSRVLSVVLLCVGLLCLAQARPGPDSNYNINVSAGGFTPGCTQSSNFLARATTVTVTADKQNYDTLLCGLETDGIGCSTTLDALYIIAAPDSTAELLNLCSASFALVSNGTNTFTANQGSASNGTTGYLNTQFTPSTAAGFLTLNSASIANYDRTSRTTTVDVKQIGARSTGTDYLLMQNRDASGLITADANDGAFLTAANANAQGFYQTSRTAASGVGALQAYRNGTSVATNTGASTNLSTQNVTISAFNNAGTINQWTTDQIAAAVIGAGMNATQAGNLSTRINAFMTSIGANVY